MVDVLTRSIPRAATIAALAISLWPTAMQAVSIELSSATAVRGGKVLISGVVRQEGEDAAGLSVTMTPADGIMPAVRSNGRPQCISHCPDFRPATAFAAAAVSLDEDDPIGGPAKECGGSFFGFVPSGCYPGLNCDSVVYLELVLYAVDPLPEGGTLFTCTFEIEPDIEPGTYDIVCSNPQSANANAEQLETHCTDAVVHVVCPGDCNADGQVTVDELVSGFEIAQGQLTTADCAALDIDADRAVSIAELVHAFRSLLEGCSAE